ncbi:MAG: 2TM domain-containing protein [Cyanobacteria bacterium P01_A01_bin.135]
MPNNYDEAAVQQILAIARARQGQRGPLTRAQLIDISRELNISPGNFLAAEEEWLVRQEEQTARNTFDQYRYQRLLAGARRFSIVSGLLLLADFLSTQHFSWSIYVTLGWLGIIALQAWQIYGASEDSYNRAFRRWWLRQQIGESFKAISERLRSPTSDEAPPRSTAAAVAFNASPKLGGEAADSTPQPLGGREP